MALVFYSVMPKIPLLFNAKLRGCDASFLLTGLAQEGISPEIIQKLSPVEVKEGQTAKFQCRVFGKPMPEVEWYKDESLIELDADGISFDTKDGYELLIIHDVSLSDEADYKVLARNPLGTATSSAELLVEESVEKPELIEPLQDVKVLYIDF